MNILLNCHKQCFHYGFVYSRSLKPPTTFAKRSLKSLRTLKESSKIFCLNTKHSNLLPNRISVEYFCVQKFVSQKRLFRSTSTCFVEKTSEDGDNDTTNDTANKNTLILTERCLKRLRQVLDDDEILRVGVRGGGCSGFEYEFIINKRTELNSDEDIVFENCVIVDRESLEYMSGSKLDYEDELIRSGFRIVDNPLAEKGCSCGVSFSLKF